MEDQADKTRLSIPEAVLLGHALVSRVAASRGIRAFFIKGPASVIQGLRMPKVSADVDVFVAPSDLDAILEGLGERGWRERTSDQSRRVFANHSVTLDHAFWPCCIDVHFRFPGMEGAPGAAFESMWARTEEIDLAGQDMRVPSKPLGILILALHALRSPHLQVCHEELEFLKELTERESYGVDILGLARATGSLAAMRPFLEDVLPNTATVDWPDASAEWRNRLLVREPRSARIFALIEAPIRRKPGMLFAALFPPPSAYLSQGPFGYSSEKKPLSAYVARWVHFLRAAPRIVKDLSQTRPPRR